MRRVLKIALAFLVVFGTAEVVYAGLGEPVSSRSSEEALKAMKSLDAYKNALEVLKEQGYSKERAEAALEKLPPGQLELLGSELEGMKAGGDIIGFLLFVLFIALIVYLIIILVEASSYRRY